MTEYKPLDPFKIPLTGLNLVEASAGTGKTYNITSLYIRALLEQNLEPSQILVVTFTEAATAELKSRIRGRIRDSLEALKSGNSGEDNFLNELLKKDYPEGKAKLKSALNDFDEAAVFTIHGFCNRVLSEHGLLFDLPPNFELLTDASGVLQDSVDEYWRTFLESTDEDKLNWFTLDYLTEDGFGPDELKKIVDKVLTHPQSRIVPEGMSSHEFRPLIKELKESFERLKQYWEKDGDQISDMYLNNKLDGRKYKESKTKYVRWEDLKHLLNSSTPKINISDDLYYFGMYMKEEGSKTEFQVPELDFFWEMDTYIKLTNELKFLKPAFIKESVQEIRSRFAEKKRASNVLSYNDLLELTETGLKNDSSGLLVQKLRKQYPLALVDEFQDTDPIQYSIFREIYHGSASTGLFMIGDPKQAIYGFRGADIFTYLSAKKDADENQSYKLFHNYRSNRDIIAAVNVFFGQSKNPFLLDGFEFIPAQFPEGKEEEVFLTNHSGDSVKPLQFIAMKEEEYSNKEVLKSEVYEVLSDEIENLLSGNFLLNGREVEEKDIAILVREGKEGETIQEALRSRGISSVLRSRSSVFETKEAEELLRILTSVQKISFEPGVRSALVTSLLDFSADDILQFEQNEKRWSDIILSFTKIKDQWAKSGIDAALDLLFREFEVIEKLSLKAAAERRISNLFHISELLSKAERGQKLNPKSLLKWFFRKVNDDSGNASSEDEELRLESDQDLVQITTMHASKGLEYPVVFCPFLWSSKSTRKSNDVLKFYKDDAIHIDISQSIEHDQQAEYKQLTELQNRAEDVRLTYVALTRAVSACFIILPNYNKINESSLAYALNGGNRYGDFYDFEAISKVLKEEPNIELRTPHSPTKRFLSNRDEAEETLQADRFSRKDLFRFPRMLSYSSLAGDKDEHDDELDYGEFYTPVVTSDSGKKDQFGFPKGADAGTFLHKVFEDVEFGNPQNLHQIVSDNLEQHGIEESWKSHAVQWIENVLSHSLGTPDASLKELPEHKLLKEMEFYFPVADLIPSQLWSIIRSENSIHPTDDEQLHGFMKGFIDLTFEHQGKYYILDYKSNFLGDNYEDYSSGNLKKAMMDAGYDLQYHIYTLALHRYLGSRLNGYDFAEHFGGVLYVFLRGVKKGDRGSGVYFHKPEFEIISKLDRYFRGEKQDV